MRREVRHRDSQESGSEQLLRSLGGDEPFTLEPFDALPLSPPAYSARFKRRIFKQFRDLRGGRKPDQAPAELLSLLRPPKDENLGRSSFAGLHRGEHR